MAKLRTETVHLKSRRTGEDLRNHPAVKQPPFDFKLFADHIAALSEIGKMVKKSKLTDRAMLLLLHDMTGVPMVKIKAVLDALPELESKYLK